MLWASADCVTRNSAQNVKLPHFVNYGVKEAEKEKLFSTLPALSAEAHVKTTLTKAGPLLPHEVLKVAQAAQAEGEEREYYKAGLLARIVDLRNANAKGIAFENRQRCIAAFSAPERPNDTGRPEVQGACYNMLAPVAASHILALPAAILTMRIRSVWDHLMRNKKDVASRRGLRILVHQRAKILRYLKSVDHDRYDDVLERLGLEPDAVEGELIV